MNLSLDESYALVAWLACVLNIIVAGWFLNQVPLRRSPA